MLRFHQLWAGSAGSRESVLAGCEWVQHLHSPHLTLSVSCAASVSISSNQLLFPGCFPAFLVLSKPNTFTCCYQQPGPDSGPAHAAPELPIPLLVPPGCRCFEGHLQLMKGNWESTWGASSCTDIIVEGVSFALAGAGTLL